MYVSPSPNVPYSCTWTVEGSQSLLLSLPSSSIQDKVRAANICSYHFILLQLKVDHSYLVLKTKIAALAAFQHELEPLVGRNYQIRPWLLKCLSKKYILCNERVNRRGSLAAEPHFTNRAYAKVFSNNPFKQSIYTRKDTVICFRILVNQTKFIFCILYYTVLDYIWTIEHCCGSPVISTLVVKHCENFVRNAAFWKTPQGPKLPKEKNRGKMLCMQTFHIFPIDLKVSSIRSIFDKKTLLKMGMKMPKKILQTAVCESIFSRIRLLYTIQIQRIQL